MPSQSRASGGEMQEMQATPGVKLALALANVASVARGREQQALTCDRDGEI